MVVLGAEPTMPGLTLPPAYRLVRRGGGRRPRRACRIAAEEGAGAFVWAGRPAVLDFAVVLEPDEPLVSRPPRGLRRHGGDRRCARRLRAAREAHHLRVPDDGPFDGAGSAAGASAWPEGCAEDAVPDRLVFSGMLLAEPGAGPIPAPIRTRPGSRRRDSIRPSAGVVASFARHLMVAFDGWAEGGFKAVADAYLARLPRRRARAAAGSTKTGISCSTAKGGLERVPLLPGLLETAWRGSRHRVAAAVNTMKFLRTLRLDPSDTFVFARAAEPGEWAVAGSVLLWGDDIPAMRGRSARRVPGGFLGFDASASRPSSRSRRSGRRNGTRSSRPSRRAPRALRRPDAARPPEGRAGGDRLRVVALDHEIGTVIGMRRTVEEGAIREQFRTLRRREPAPRSRPAARAGAGLRVRRDRRAGGTGGPARI